jgi:hypothetical protein
MEQLITFYGGFDSRIRDITVPTVARLAARFGEHTETKYVVVGTAYWYIHTSAGDIRTWNSYSGARKAARNYRAGV